MGLGTVTYVVAEMEMEMCVDLEVRGPTAFRIDR